MSQRQPPGPLLIAFIGGLMGAIAALVITAIVRDIPTMEAIQDPLIGDSKPLGLGFLVGFFAVGLMVRNRLVVLLLRGLGKTLLLALGMAGGAGLGGLLYALTVMGAEGGLGPAISHTLSIATRPGSTAGPFILGGALAALVGMLYAAGRSTVKVGARVMAGGLVGAMAGLVIYCIAYVLIFAPTGDDRPNIFILVAEAMYSFTPSEVLLVAVAAGAGAILSRYSWRLYGILTFVSLLFVVLGYSGYTLTETLPYVPAEDRWISWLLFIAEVSSLSMVLLYSFYTIDVAARKHWRRSTVEAMFSPYYLPKVAIHVPTFNEPFELVKETLDRLVKLDYPTDRVVIMVADDSTRPECAQPIKEYCAKIGVQYHTRADRTGYKAGALNMLLEKTPVDCNLLAIIDADYQVEPEYLRETVGFFVDPDLGWLQTPQDYRNRHQSFLTEQYYLADAYFYRTILPSRNEENSIIFCGTMGMLRMRAVLEVGGWNEKCITEDAELSVRLLNAGWNSLYVNKTYGRGLIPPTFEAYKKQHYRWAFGGGRILRTHFFRFVFGRFTFRQRLDYLVGSFNWFEGTFIFAISLFILTMAGMDLAGSDVITHHDSEILLVGLVPLFLLLDGLTRVHLVLRRAVNLTFGGTLRILGMWFSVKFSDMRAALKALIGLQIPFVRTPKAPAKRPTSAEAWGIALRLTRFESSMAFILVLGAFLMGFKALTAPDQTDGQATGRMFLSFWLTYYAVIFAAAPIYAYKSFATLRTDAEMAASPGPLVPA
ncbi:MAG TPA: glycosyltransferase [Candidatus Thermoplasmatota archaeon]|nr:glycosyltransferase [Candidatus Thermoplasmatota archaeon]